MLHFMLHFILKIRNIPLKIQRFIFILKSQKHCCCAIYKENRLWWRFSLLACPMGFEPICISQFIIVLLKSLKIRDAFHVAFSVKYLSAISIKLTFAPFIT